MINFIVCDDEKEIVEKVKIILMKIAFQANIEYKIHAFNSYDESFMQTMNSNLENKIYILDIEVEDSSGLEVAKQIREKDWKSIIVILTAHYELETLAYKSKILLLDFISKYETSESLKGIKEKLKGNFMYTHKSCIINMDNVKTIDIKNKVIVFSNNTKTDLLSRKYLKEVKEYVNN